MPCWSWPETEPCRTLLLIRLSFHLNKGKLLTDFQAFVLLFCALGFRTYCQISSDHAQDALQAGYPRPWEADAGLPGQ